MLWHRCEAECQCIALRAEVGRSLRPRVSPALARRLGRLTARAHRFHRFAHHPLCNAYAAEVLHLGRRTHVCAGCAWTLLGSILGVGVAAACPRGWFTLPWALGLQGAGMVWLLVSARLHAQVLKWLVRGGPMVCLAGGCVLTLRAGAAIPWHLGVWATEAALSAVAWGAVRVYRRRPPWRAPCVSCPQRQDEVCDGWRPMVQRERALTRLSGQWLQSSHRGNVTRSASGCAQTAVDFRCSSIT